jgi:hypothetical protein
MLEQRSMRGCEHGPQSMRVTPPCSQTTPQTCMACDWSSATTDDRSLLLLPQKPPAN